MANSKITQLLLKAGYNNSGAQAKNAKADAKKKAAKAKQKQENPLGSIEAQIDAEFPNAAELGPLKNFGIPSAIHELSDE